MRKEGGARHRNRHGRGEGDCNILLFTQKRKGKKRRETIREQERKEPSQIPKKRRGSNLSPRSERSKREKKKRRGEKSPFFLSIVRGKGNSA